MKLPQPKKKKITVPQSSKPMQQHRRGTFGTAHTGLLSVIPIRPDGITLSIGVHKCTYLSRNVTALIRVLFYLKTYVSTFGYAY